ncbi:MAG: hypothetical protein GXP10_05260 [Gammaproteobacteria bacterium]|nr:hypothetical protein [Gammaproteobacteria bacterium]
MKRTWLLLFISLFLMMGCTAVTTVEETETAVPDQSSPNTPEEKLGVDALEAQPEELLMNETPEADPTPTDDGSKQVSEPVIVDLSAVTPVPMNSTPVVQPAPGSPNPSLDEFVPIAMADLSNRLNIAVDEIEFLSIKEVTWRDGSLGCPEAGMAYLQVLSSGQQMILRVNGQDYYYHSGKSGVFNYCGDPQPPIENMEINPNQPPPPGQDN